MYIYGLFWLRGQDSINLHVVMLFLPFLICFVAALLRDRENNKAYPLFLKSTFAYRIKKKKSGLGLERKKTIIPGFAN